MSYEIHTRMEKGDYHRFLYIATLGRNPWMVPLLAGIALVGALLCSLGQAGIRAGNLFVLWLVFMLLALVSVCLKVESANRRRRKTDQTGMLESESVLTFYGDRVHMENPAMKARWELDYNRFHSLLESRDYFIFYLTANQASLIRKKDVPDEEGFRRFLQSVFVGKYKKTWM